MHLLKNIPIGIDTNNDGVHFGLNLFSKGTKANYNDDFPMSIVRTIGARVEIVNNAYDNLFITKIFLGVVLNFRLVEIWASSQFESKKKALLLVRDNCYEIAIEGKELINIFDNYKSEKGVIIIQTSNKIIRSDCFDGGYIEKELNRLNRDTDPEYQNWNIDGYHRLDIKLKENEISDELKELFSS